MPSVSRVASSTLATVCVRRARPRRFPALIGDGSSGWAGGCAASGIVTFTWAGG